MRKKNEFFIYTCMWVAAVVVLMALLLQSLGDARIVNYSGIVRGATQKLVKEEMNGQPDDDLIIRLDGIIENLRTGEGGFNLRKNSDPNYQDQLDRLSWTWGEIKQEIAQVRQGLPTGRLYVLSQRHFSEADRLTLLAEEGSDRKLLRFIAIYGVALLLSVCGFTALNARSQRALERSIYTDNLTGLLNRAGFEAGAGDLIRQRPGTRYCLIEFDVDDFKFFNNSYGYERGDQLLQTLAGGLRGRYCGEELCARLAADDFVILARGDAQTVGPLRLLLQEALHRGPLQDVSEFITFTVGGYEIPENSRSIQSVIDRAGMAHKSAKALGKSTTVWYNDQLLEQLNRENRLKNRLRHALEAGEFKMYLQPKVLLSTLEINSAEALVRWEIPGQGIVPPDRFIPLFERNGAVAEIDFYMLEQACEFLRRQAGGGDDFCISVNFSRVTLYQQRFYPTVLEIVDRWQIPHRCIEIEITESAFNEISEAMVQKVERLKEAGFVISMDDFGSGYSSLNLIDKLPIQVIKLDRGFLREYDGSDKVRKVIGCVTELAHILNMKVVCEGVEELEQVEFLRETGCDYAQGYYFSRPIPSGEFARQYQMTRA